MKITQKLALFCLSLGTIAAYGMDSKQNNAPAIQSNTLLPVIKVATTTINTAQTSPAVSTASISPNVVVRNLSAFKPAQKHSAPDYDNSSSDSSLSDKSTISKGAWYKRCLSDNQKNTHEAKPVRNKKVRWATQANDDDSSSESSASSYDSEIELMLQQL